MRRAGLWLLGGLAALLLLSWLGLPPLVRSVAQSQLSELLGRPVSIASVRFNPLSLTLRVEGLAIGGASAGAPPALELAAAEVNADLRSVLRGAPVLESLTLEAPHLRLARLAEGRYDIDDLLARLAQRPKPAAEDPAPPRFALYNLSVRGGSFEFDDQPVARQHKLDQLTLGLPVISTLDAASIAIKVEPRLAFSLDGTLFDTGAQAAPFSRDRAGRLQLRSGDIDLAAWLPYLPAELPLRPTAGHLAVDLVLQFAAPPDAPPQAALSGSVRLQQLRLADRGGSTLLQLPSFTAALQDVQPLQRKVMLGAVELAGLQLDLARDAQGRLNLLQALQSAAPASRDRPAAAPRAASPASAASAGAGPQTPDARAWQLALSRLSLRDSKVHWQDASTRPAADLMVELPLVQLDQARWPLAPAQPPATWQIDARWGAPGAEGTAGTARLEGRLGAEGGQAGLSLEQASLGALAPYVAQQITPRLAGQVTATARAEWAGLPGQGMPQLSVPSLVLTGLQLTSADAGKAVETRKPARAPGPVAGRQGLSLASVQRLELEGLAVDLERRRVVLRRLQITQPQADLRRAGNGVLNIQQWQVAGSADEVEKPVGTASAPTAEAAGPAWRLELADAGITGGQVAWRDEGAGQAPVQLELSALKLTAKGLQWPAVAGSPVRLQGSVQLAAPRPDAPADRSAVSRLTWNGQLGLSPLAWRGKAQVERFPVHAVAPYLGALPVEIVRAEAGWTGDVNLAMSAQGASVQAAGDARLTDLRVHARRPTESQGGPSGSPQDPGAELLTWQSLALDRVKLALAPGGRPQVQIGQVVLSEFFAKLLITEQGRLNLTDLAPPPDAAAGSAPDAAGPIATAAAASSPDSVVAIAAFAPSAPLPAASSPEPAVATAWPLDLEVGGVELRGGRVDFTDRFIRPNYSADLSRLEGRLGAFRSGSTEPATLALTGRVAGTALLDVRGSLNPLARPLALDVQARATDLELAPLSPYAAKYAGYAIERGKLSMDVSYKIQPDGRLQARNQIVLNQLTFGEKVESPTATRLPVLLAVSLLKDRHGVIDLDLPIGGSINDPEFSVGGLIVKVILNLLTKALMAPFSLLSGSDATDLSPVPFLPGTATLAPAALPALEKVAKSLEDRPALKMTVTGQSDPQAEQDAMRAALLEARLQTERRQELARSGQAVPSGTVDLAAEERARLVQRVYADTRLPDKPRNLIGLAKEIPLAEMEARLKSAYPVNADTARELALQRGLAVRDALIAKGLANERLFLAAPKLHAPTGEQGAAAGDWTPSAQLSLGTQ